MAAAVPFLLVSELCIVDYLLLLFNFYYIFIFYCVVFWRCWGRFKKISQDKLISYGRSISIL